jgi:hypothetical protein
VYCTLGLCVLGSNVYELVKWTIFKQTTPTLSSDNAQLLRLENDIFKEACRGLVNYETMDADISVDWKGKAIPMKIHIIRMFLTHNVDNIDNIDKQSTTPPPSSVLCIHGMNTGPIYFRSVVVPLVTQTKSDLYLLALPGFGVVDIHKEVIDSTQQDILDFYCTYLHKVVTIFLQMVIPNLLYWDIRWVLTCPVTFIQSIQLC